MDDEADRLSNLCMDLVSLRRLEPALEYLLRSRPAGSWTPVRELYDRAGEETESIQKGLNAAWLPAPGADSGYAVVVFFDDETKWALTAEYNAARLSQQVKAVEAATP